MTVSMIYDLTSHGRDCSSFLRHITTASSLPVDIDALVLGGRFLTSDLFPIFRSCLAWIRCSLHSSTFFAAWQIVLYSMDTT
jgi:hypothetical protein